MRFVVLDRVQLRHKAHGAPDNRALPAPESNQELHQACCLEAPQPRAAPDRAAKLGQPAHFPAPVNGDGTLKLRPWGGVRGRGEMRREFV